MNKSLPHLAPQNLIDKAITYFAPQIGAKRMAARMQIGALGGYNGARVDTASLNRYNPRAGSAHTDIIPGLSTLRGRSRDQMRNAPVALGAMNTTNSHVIGTGLSYTPDIDAEFLGLTEEEAEKWCEDTKRRFETWANSQDCDLGRRFNFYALQSLAFRSMFESGDVFVVTPRVARSGKLPALALQLIEADRVCNPKRAADSKTIIDGIEIDPTTNETTHFHISRCHPGDYQQSNEWDRIAARGAKTGRKNVLHIFRPTRIDQVRGVPEIAPIIEPLKQLQRYTDAELNAAVISGLFSVFIKMDPQAFDDLFDEDAKGALIGNASNWSGEMQSGKAINLLPGESIESSNPGRPNAQFDPFWQAIVRQIGMALELPFEVLTMHYQSSYSAARAALLMAWKNFRTRREFFASNLCQPVLELWLEDEVAQGRINAPGFFEDEIVRAAWCKAIWTGDGPGSIDPEKEVNAAKKRIDLGISTKQTESILHDGQDWESKHEQRVKEINAEKRDGIYVQPDGALWIDPNNDQQNSEID